MFRKEKKGNKRSPLKDKPLRSAGQSLDDAIDERFSDAMDYVGLALATVMLAGFEWWRYLRHDTFHPWTFTFLALLAIPYSFYKWRKIIWSIRASRLGRDGERIVGEFLDQLRPLGYTVLHDVVGGNFNVDHVLIGPAGVFAIETKTLSKSGGAEETIQFDGTNIFIHGRTVDPNPVNQAQANARWIRELLKDSTSKAFEVTPVVLYPGWYVEQKTKLRDVLVLNPKNLEPLLKSRPPILPSSEISLAAFHLKRFIRST